MTTNDSLSPDSVSRELKEYWTRGNRRSLDRLAPRFSPLIRHRITSSQRWARLAEKMSLADVEQEVWLRVIRAGRGSYVAGGVRHAFVSWLTHIIDSTVTDLVRILDAKKRGGGEEPEALAELSGERKIKNPGQPTQIPTPSAEARVTEFEMMAREVLTEREFTVWRWVVVENYSSVDVALALGCSSAAVRSLLLRSRAKLRDQLSSRSRS